MRVKLEDKELCILVDFKSRVAEYRYEEECECDTSCFPHTRDVCTSCSLAVNEVLEEIQRQEQDERDRGDWHHDDRDGYLDDGQTFYNHHEANDSWFKD
jgi:hypothetical protein